MPSYRGVLGPCQKRRGGRYIRLAAGMAFVALAAGAADGPAGVQLAGVQLAWVRLARAGLPEVEAGLQQGRYQEALSELNSLAYAGDARAQRRLGDLLYHGLAFRDRVVVALNRRAAARWYEQAVDQGDRVAMLRLGLLYAEGLGGRRNPVLAYGLVGLAAAKGEPEAVALRDTLAKQLTRRQREQGDRLIREMQTGS